MEFKSNQVSRYGAYGIVLSESKLLLTLKAAGPFKGLWDLPGGSIEFGERPEEACKRELLEETALAASQFELFSIVTFNNEYDNNDGRYAFHHIGIIYKVTGAVPMANLVAEEEMQWISLCDIKQEELTPFAKHVTKELITLII